jgi:hypothetical protein
MGLGLLNHALSLSMRCTGQWLWLHLAADGCDPAVINRVLPRAQAHSNFHACTEIFHSSLQNPTTRLFEEWLHNKQV